MTYSIVAGDPETGDLGVAVQSKFPGVGGLVSYARGGVGAVATQAFGNPRHGTEGLDLMAKGALPEEAGAILLRGDDNRDQRQFALIDAVGGVFAFMGDEVATWGGWAGHAVGDFCVAQGNGLAGEGVVQAMVGAFTGTAGDLAVRLIASLQAGEAAGGELRGQQSAAVLVVREGGGYGGLDDRRVDIPVYDHPSPIDELERCFTLHKLSYLPSDPEMLREIDADLAEELQGVLVREGFLDGPATADWSEREIKAMSRYMGWWNYDNRIREDALVDEEVLADIRRRENARRLDSASP